MAAEREHDVVPSSGTLDVRRRASGRPRPRSAGSRPVRPRTGDPLAASSSLASLNVRSNTSGTDDQDRARATLHDRTVDPYGAVLSDGGQCRHDLALGNVVENTSVAALRP